MPDWYDPDWDIEVAFDTGFCFLTQARHPSRGIGNIKSGSSCNVRLATDGRRLDAESGAQFF